MPDKREVWFVMKCGCILTRDKLKKKIHGRLSCPEHDRTIASKYSYCIRCGDKIVSNAPQSSVPLRCIECNPGLKAQKAKTKKLLKEKPAKPDPEKIIEVIMERSECIYRPLCVEVNINKIRLPCYKCKDFVNKKRGVLKFNSYDINLNNLDTFIKDFLNFDSGIEKNELKRKGLIEWGPIFTKRTKDMIEILKKETKLKQKKNNIKEKLNDNSQTII